MRIYLFGFYVLVALSELFSCPVYATGEVPKSERENAAQETSGDNVVRPEFQRALAPGQPLQIQLIVPQKEAEAGSAKTILGWVGAIVALCSVVAGYISLGKQIRAGRENIDKQIKSSQENIEKQIDAARNVIGIQFENQVAIIDEQRKSQRIVEEENEIRKKISVLTVIVHEMNYLRRVASDISGGDPLFLSFSDGEIKRVEIDFPDILRIDWLELSLIADPDIFQNIFALRRIFQRLSRRINYILSLKAEERGSDPTSAEYLGDIGGVLASCSKAAERLRDAANAQLSNYGRHIDFSPTRASAVVSEDGQATIRTSLRPGPETF